IIDVHFFYPMKMKIFYPERDNPAALEEAINACLKQIEISDKTAPAFRTRYRDNQLPFHEGYEQLCIIYEKQGRFDEAIKLAKQGKGQGWGNNWDDRIERCQ